MGDGEPAVPPDLAASWQRATTAPDPLAALGSIEVLARGVGRWQSALAGEAIRNGATWEEIGEALGISRQAAWARFHHVVEEKEGGAMEAETAQLKQMIHEEVRGLRDAMKALDETHRQARTEARDRLRAVEQEARQERQELRARMKETIRSLQEQLRTLKGRAEGTQGAAES